MPDVVPRKLEWLRCATRPFTTKMLGRNCIQAFVPRHEQSHMVAAKVSDTEIRTRAETKSVKHGVHAALRFTCAPSPFDSARYSNPSQTHISKGKLKFATQYTAYKREGVIEIMCRLRIIIGC